jgi:hypothetical protein
MICPEREVPVEEGGTMTQTATQEPQAPEVARIERVEDLPDALRAQLVQSRREGQTLAELKAAYPHVAPEVIREVLPAGNARERKAREAKGKVTESTQGTGGRSGEAKPPKAEAAPKPPPAPRYVEDADLLVSLSERTLACRQVVGRGALAEALGTTQSAVWRAEQGRIHPTEVEGLKAGLDAVEKRIAEGEFVKTAAEPRGAQPTKAELLHRVEATAEYLRTGTKGLSGKAVAEAALALLDPPTQAATESE